MQSSLLSYHPPAKTPMNDSFWHTPSKKKKILAELAEAEAFKYTFKAKTSYNPSMTKDRLGFHKAGLHK